jgi:4-alpha-glucanotransferase
MSFPRASGVLMHISSLPFSPAIGDLGSAAYKFVDFLAQSGQRYWQVLPLGPTGYGDSPYQSFSAFAGNPLLISPEQLIHDGLLLEADYEQPENQNPHHIDYGFVVEWKKRMLLASYKHFVDCGTNEQKEAFKTFSKVQKTWLDDYALFMSIKQDLDMKAWWEWSAPLKLGDKTALNFAKKRLKNALSFYKYQQWLFFSQWERVHQYASSKNIQIIGDLPIFVARDSAEAWAHPELFMFDVDANPIVVAGVPPDYFSETGQLWGNPIYNWKKMQKDRFKWWIARFKALLATVDILRVDHFRGFAEYWAVPGGDETAINGKWVECPGKEMFETVLTALGELPIMAEDLGLMTQSVIDLRDHFGFPGMHILQFAFARDIGAETEADAYPHLPHHYPTNSVTYTGTHDNNTTLGWWENDATEAEKEKLETYLKVSGDNVVWDLIHTGFGCASDTFIVPMQDLLCFGQDARMNFPGKAGGNWQWRCPDNGLSNDLAATLKALTIHSGRMK